MKIVYSVYDKKAKAFGPIMAYRNDVIAIRDFAQVCSEKSSLIRKYPEDYDLIALAEFDDEVDSLAVAVMEGLQPRLVMSAVAAVALETRDDA